MKNKVFTFRLDDLTYEKLGKLADFHLRSRGNLLRMLIQDAYQLLDFQGGKLPNSQENQAHRIKLMEACKGERNGC